MTYLVLYVLSTFHPAIVNFAGDTGRGKCPALIQHYHNGDGFCHWDSDDHIVKLLPKVTR